MDTCLILSVLCLLQLIPSTVNFKVNSWGNIYDEDDDAMTCPEILEETDMTALQKIPRPMRKYLNLSSDPEEQSTSPSKMHNRGRGALRRTQGHRTHHHASKRQEVQCEYMVAWIRTYFENPCRCPSAEVIAEDSLPYWLRPFITAESGSSGGLAGVDKMSPCDLQQWIMVFIKSRQQDFHFRDLALSLSGSGGSRKVIRGSYDRSGGGGGGGGLEARRGVAYAHQRPHFHSDRRMGSYTNPKSRHSSGGGMNHKIEKRIGSRYTPPTDFVARSANRIQQGPLTLPVKKTLPGIYTPPRKKIRKFYISNPPPPIRKTVTYTTTTEYLTPSDSPNGEPVRRFIEEEPIVETTIINSKGIEREEIDCGNKNKRKSTENNEESNSEEEGVSGCKQMNSEMENVLDNGGKWIIEETVIKTPDSDGNTNTGRWIVEGETTPEPVEEMENRKIWVIEEVIEGRPDSAEEYAIGDGGKLAIEEGGEVPFPTEKQVNDGGNVQIMEEVSEKLPENVEEHLSDVVKKIIIIEEIIEEIPVSSKEFLVKDGGNMIREEKGEESSAVPIEEQIYDSKNVQIVEEVNERLPDNIEERLPDGVEKIIIEIIEEIPEGYVNGDRESSNIQEEVEKMPDSTEKLVDGDRGRWMFEEISGELPEHVENQDHGNGEKVNIEEIVESLPEKHLNGGRWMEKEEVDEKMPNVTEGHANDDRGKWIYEEDGEKIPNIGVSNTEHRQGNEGKWVFEEDGERKPKSKWRYVVENGSKWIDDDSGNIPVSDKSDTEHRQANEGKWVFEEDGEREPKSKWRYVVENGSKWIDDDSGKIPVSDNSDTEHRQANEGKWVFEEDSEREPKSKWRYVVENGSKWIDDDSGRIPVSDKEGDKPGQSNGGKWFMHGDGGTGISKKENVDGDAYILNGKKHTYDIDDGQISTLTSVEVIPSYSNNIKNKTPDEGNKKKGRRSKWVFVPKEDGASDNKNPIENRTSQDVLSTDDGVKSTIIETGAGITREGGKWITDENNGRILNSGVRYVIEDGRKWIIGKDGERKPISDEEYAHGTGGKWNIVEDGGRIPNSGVRYVMGEGGKLIIDNNGERKPILDEEYTHGIGNWKYSDGDGRKENSVWKYVNADGSTRKSLGDFVGINESTLNSGMGEDKGVVYKPIEDVLSSRI